ncbi:MAG: hypothetical protein IJ811_02280 [Clostridia bacterium]|nr:hypothetical protein [Clostridia bacterium]
MKTKKLPFTDVDVEFVYVDDLILLTTSVADDNPYSGYGDDVLWGED